jgi:ABC-2 type transport system permease protein
MSSITQPAALLSHDVKKTNRMPLLGQVIMMTRRNLATLFREPTWILPIFLGVFFLLIYTGSLSGAASFFLSGQSYLGFILPLSVISTALSAASSAGQAIIRDIESGYFDKLLLTPISRSALLLGPMNAAAIALVIQICPLVVIALLMGLDPATGVIGLVLLLGYALLIGLGLAGFIVGIALRTSNAGATASASFLVFPLTFLTATFTPVELLTGWIRVAARFNPITYILEATRALLNTGWEGEVMLRGLVVSVSLCAITFAFALFSLRARTKRR